MKKLLFLGIAFVGFSLASCNKDILSPDSQLSNISANAGGVGDAGTANADTTRMPPPKLDSIAISSLPTTITTYISSNYAGATVQKAGKDKDGNFVVLISQNNTPKGLLFNSSGVFQKELPAPPQGKGGPMGGQQGGPKGQGGNGGQQGQGGTNAGQGQQAPPQLTAVDVKNLPSAITTYISTKYTGATVDKAGTDKDGNYVVLILVNNQPKGLLFDAKGTFQKELPPPPKKG